MNKLFYDGDRFITVPSKWEELNSEQITAIIAHLHSISDLQEHRLDSLLILTSCKSNVRTQKIIADLSSENRLDVAKFMTWWIYATPIYYTQNPFPKYKEYIGPGDEFKHLYFEEFIKAEKFYLSYAKDHKTEDLDNLIACLYRRKKLKRDKENPFNTEDPRPLYTTQQFNKMQKEIADWPLNVKMAIFYYYDSCMQLMTQVFEWAFKPGNKSTPKLKNESPKTLYHIARQLAGGVEIEKILLRPIVNIYFELNEARQDAERMKLSMKPQPKTRK